MGWWLHTYYRGFGALFVVSWVFWILFSVTFHELAHGWAALRQGDRTPVERKRMTWNPIVHMGTTSLIVFALIGIAWGVMPVNPSRFRNRRWGAVFVAGAGPAANLALFAAAVVLARTASAIDVFSDQTLGSVMLFLWVGAFLNLALALFNLMPLPPLDGSRILERLVPAVRPFYAKPEAAMFGLAIFFAVFFMSGLGNVLWEKVMWAAAFAMGAEV